MPSLRMLSVRVRLLLSQDARGPSPSALTWQVRRGEEGEEGEEKGELGGVLVMSAGALLLSMSPPPHPTPRELVASWVRDQGCDGLSVCLHM